MTNVIHAENKFGKGESLPLDGVGLDAAVGELVNAYVAPEHAGIMDIHGDHPVIERQRRIQDNSKGLDKLVENILGKNVKSSQAQAKDIAKTLAHALATAEGEFKGELKDFKDEDVRKYTSKAGQALGNPAISNYVELVKSIMNMASAKPGDVAYDTRSALAQLIQYVATRKDKQSLRVEYLQTLLQEHSTDMRYITALQGALGHAVGRQFTQEATIPDMITELNDYATLQSQRALAQTDKTHLQPAHPAPAHYEAAKRAA